MEKPKKQMGSILDLALSQSHKISPSKANFTNNLPEPQNTVNMYEQIRYPEVMTSSTYEYTEFKDSIIHSFETKLEVNDTNKHPNSDTPILDTKYKNANTKNLPVDLPLQPSGAMISSICSSLAETPGDSGVLCLDSETSELTGEYPPGMSLSLVEAEELVCDNPASDGDNIEPDNRPKATLVRNKSIDLDDVMTQSDIENQNITPPMYEFDVSESLKCLGKRMNVNNTLNEHCDSLPDVVKTSHESNHVSKSAVLQKTTSFDLCSAESLSTSGTKPKNIMETMKSASDDIVYRRKCNKKSSNSSQPKKRVSFHEDILNNTKTDNIHIEHGFVMYRPEASMSYFSGSNLKKVNNINNRYSWCTVGDSKYFDSQQPLSRNARSDVLTYGRTDVTGYPDKSGIYEYQDDNYLSKNVTKSCDSEHCVNKINACKCSKEELSQNPNDSPMDQRQLYICSCNSSDSNLSSESETSSSQTLSFNSDTNVKYNEGATKKCDSAQKSYSCDCIENNISRPMMRTMYFSDADINNHADLSNEDTQLQMSEILPRASCLKKSSLKKKRYIRTDIIEEHDSKNILTENRRSMRNLLDSKTLFGSLKNIYKNINFGLTIAERGVPEGSEDCQSVLEVLPPENIAKPSSSFLSKSFDAGFDNAYPQRDSRVKVDSYSRNYTHEVDNQLRRRCDNAEGSMFKSDVTEREETNVSKPQNDISKQSLTLDMKANNSKTFMDWKVQNNMNSLNNDPFGAANGARNKYIVNCESTVYEHKGVSYCYEYDTFKTTFDTSKDTFTPINDNMVPVSTQNMSKDKQDNTSNKVDEIDVTDTNDNPSTSKDKDDQKKLASEAHSENESMPENSDKAKFKVTKYMMDKNDSTKIGVSKHLSSPLKQRNIMRYEKSTKFVSDNKECNDSTIDSSSVQDTINEIIDFDETIELADVKDFQTKNFSNRKASLMNRFLKNVGQKKAFDSKLKNNVFFQKKLKEESTKFPNICYPANEKISPTFKLSAKYIDSMINKEVMENKRVSVKLMTADEPSYFDSFEENVAIECCEKLKLELFADSSEVLHRMLKVRSVYSQENGKWTPLLVFITDKALYVADVEHGKPSYNLICFLTHDQLDVIVIGPDSQYVKIFDITGECRCILITGDRYLCHRLVSSLEWSSRNSRVVYGSTVIMGSIPSILWKERDSLKRVLINTTSVQKFEECAYYGMVGISSPGSCNRGRPPSPFPPLEGFLMFKTEKQKYWRPSLFLLKSGVLSYGSSTPPTEPLSEYCLPHSIRLEGVLGVRRCTDVQGRPHCFEIALNSGYGSTLQMAAPDDDTASQWLQALLMHAAQALEGPKVDKSKNSLPPCCTLLATSEHIITLREQLHPPKSLTESDITLTNETIDGDDSEQSDIPNEPPLVKNCVEILSCALIKDLTAFKIPDNDDNWCILEFVFCEVREGTEMGLLFGSSAELDRFIGTVEALWHKTNNGVFPISVLPKTESVSGRCSEWHHCLDTAWDKMLPAPQR